ncbi:MAG TPA: ABC transporter transmembrane domain-containing protein, partial [Planctomycetota bacterium]|nr:ABC transporter transmembrane domain-containing protein [Planctomycetota bacterium]
MGSSPLLHLLPFFRRYRTAYVLGSASLVAAIALRLVVPRFLGDTIDALHRVEGWAADEYDAGAASRLVLGGALAIVGTALVGAFVRTWSRWTILGASRKVVHDMREELYAKLTRLAPSFYLRHSTGQILSRGLNDMQNMQGLTGPVFLYLAETGLLFAIGLSAMVAVDPWLTAAAFAPFPLFIWRARRLALEIQEGSRAAQDSLGEMSDKVAESLGGILVIKTMCLERFDAERFGAHCARYRDLNLQVTRARAALMPLMVGLTSLSILVALLVGVPLVREGRVSTGEFVAFFFYLQLLSAPIGTLGFVISSVQRGAAAMERIREVLDAEETLPDPARPLELAAPRGALSVR